MTDKFQCNFCKREFVREKSLINHICEQRRRWDSRDEKNVKLGFNCWLKWYELSGTNINNNKKYTFEEFMKSKYYLAFVKLGKHIVGTKLLNAEQFLKYVIKNRIKLDDWCKEYVYIGYIRDVCKRENVEIALERQIQIMMDWAEENDDEWISYFEKVHPNEAIKLIRTGRISPWIILNSCSIYRLFDRMSEEQVALVNDFVDLTAWTVLMKKSPKDRQFVTSTLEENGI